jgi:hypothetical protein
MGTIAAGVRGLMQRQESARASFMVYVQERTGCTEGEAAAVFDLYRRERLVKVDGYMGTWTVRHGVWLDDGVMRRAVELARG